jgi:hypothetical protein
MTDDSAINFNRSLHLDPRETKTLLEEIGSECGGTAHYSKICWLGENKIFYSYYEKPKYPLEKDSHSATVNVKT